MNVTNNLLRKPAVLAATGIRTTTLYERIKKGLFTAPARIGTRLSGWPASEVSAINAAIIAGQSDDQIRYLVISLMAKRVEDLSSHVRPSALGATLGATTFPNI